MNDWEKTKAQLIEELTELRQQVEQLKSIEQAETMSQKRAAELETVAQVSTATSTLLDTNKLLQEVVDLTKKRFDLYHAHIYLLAKETLVLTAGAGEAGRQMVAEGWQIPLSHDHSLVARAARTRQGVIVNDVQQEPDFLPNPLLPETRAELAVPMIVGGQVVGVLDIQANEFDYFAEEDIRIQTILAGQVAVAWQNARLFAQIQRQAERERLINQVTQKIQSTDTVESALQMAVKALGQALQARQTRVELTSKRGETDLISSNQDEQMMDKGYTYNLQQLRPLQDRDEDEATAKTTPLVETWLTVQGEPIGRLAVSEPHSATDEAADIVTVVAQRLSAHIENLRLTDQTQAALEEASIFRQFVEAAGQGVGFATLDGRMKYMNPAFAEILGEEDREAAVDKPIIDYYPQNLHPILTNEIMPQVMQAGRWTGEMTILATDNRLTPVIDSYFLLRDDEGKPLYLADIATNISERKQVETELRKLSWAVEQSPNIVIITNIDGYIEYVNPKFTELTGYTTEEAIGRNPRLLKSGKLSPQVYETLWETITSGREWRGEIVNRKKNGELYWASVSISPIIDAKGKITHFIALQEDITERKAYEEEREQLLAEAQEYYQRYVLREWKEFLGERHQGRWHIEYQPFDLPYTHDENVEDDNETSFSQPISILGQAIGSLKLQDMHDPNRNWTTEEKALVETVTEQLGLTIENLRLFEETQKQATREQLTRRITDKMRSLPDIDTIIQTGLNELVKALGVSRTYVKLVTEPDQIEQEAEDGLVPHNGSSASSQNEGQAKNDK